MVKLRLVQSKATPDKARNLEAALAVLDSLGPADAGSLVAFPEMYMALPSREHPPVHSAEPLDGAFVSALGRAAAARSVHVACGVWETASDAERAHNTLVVLGPDGERETSYRKTHLFDALNVRESDTMAAGGQAAPLVTIDDLNVGFAICYDLRFPELFRDLVDRGAEALVLPSAWYAGPMKEDHWLTLLRARAIENTAYVGGANHVGPTFCARSAVFDPFGVPLADAGEMDGQLVVELERDRVHQVREKLPSLEHRRGDLFAAGKAPDA